MIFDTKFIFTIDIFMRIAVSHYFCVGGIKINELFALYRIHNAPTVK